MLVKWMELETMLRKMSHTQKGKYHVFTHRPRLKLEQPFQHYKDTRLAPVMIIFNIFETKYIQIKFVTRNVYL